MSEWPVITSQFGKWNMCPALGAALPRYYSPQLGVARRNLKWADVTRGLNEAGIMSDFSTTLHIVVVFCPCLAEFFDQLGTKAQRPVWPLNFSDWSPHFSHLSGYKLCIFWISFHPFICLFVCLSPLSVCLVVCLSQLLTCIVHRTYMCTMLSSSHGLSAKGHKLKAPLRS